MEKNRNKKKWTDDDVILFALFYLDVQTLMNLEKIYGMSHSTASWVFKNRLPKLDRELYEKVMRLVRMPVQERRMRIHNGTL